MKPLKFIDQIKDMYNDQEPRSTIQGPRNMYAGGQLVRNTVDGSRPGYQGPDALGRIYEGTRHLPIPGKQGFQPTYHKLSAAGDKKLIREWKKSLTDAVKAGDMSETVGFQEWLRNKFDKKKANTIRNRVRLQLGVFSGKEYINAQENFVKSLIKKHNESDKLLHTKEDIWRKARFDKKSDMGKKMWQLMDDPETGLENIDIKINKAVDNIIDNNLPIRTSSKVGRHIAKYSPIIQMISEMSGAGSTSTIQNALLQNPKFKDKEFLETFRYLNRAHAKDFVGLPFDEALEYAKMRQGGLDVKGMLSYTTRYQNPESNIMNFAVRHANRHFRDGTKSQVQFYKLRADGTKGALMSWDKLPKNRDGNRVLDLKKVGFEYKKQFFHKNNLKTKGYRSGLFDEVYAMSGKNRLLVPDPNDPSQKITLKKLLQTTGDKLTVGHDEALGGVKGSPFKSLRLQGEKLNSALFNAYDKIQNKDLRKRVLHSLEGQFKGLSGGDYQKAFIEGKTKEAQDIINKKIDVSKRGTLYREAGREIVTDPVFKTFSPKKQREAMRIAGEGSFSNFKKGMYQQAQSNGIGVNKCGLGGGKKAEGGRIGFASGTQSFDECMRGAIADETRIAKGFGAKAKQAGQRLLGVAKWAGKWIGLIDVPVEFAFALPALLRGDIEGAKRHTTFGLFGWGETQMEQMKETNPEAYKFLKHDNDIMNWQQAEWQLEHLNEAKERLEKSKVEGGYGSNELNKINTQIEELLAKKINIEENYIGYEYADEVALGKQMLGSYVKNEADRHREARDRGEVLGMQKPIVDEAFGELTPTSIRPEKERKAIEYPDTYGGYLMKKQFDKTEGRYREDPIIEALIEEGPYMEVDEWRKRYMPEKSAISPAQLNAMYGLGAIQDYYNTVQSAQGSPSFNYAGFAGGGIAGIRRPWAIPPESGPDPYGKSIPKMAGGGRIGFFKGAQADTRSGKAMSPGTSADYSPGQGHREARETRGAPPGITTSPIPQPITPVTRNESSLFPSTQSTGFSFPSTQSTGFSWRDFVKRKIPPEYRLYAKSILPGGEEGEVGSDYFPEDFKQQLRAQALAKYTSTGKLRGQVGELEQHRGDVSVNKLTGFPSTFASLGTYTYDVDPETLDVNITDKYNWNPAYGKTDDYVGWVGDRPDVKQGDVDLSLVKDYIVNAVKDGYLDKANALEMIGSYFGGKASEGKGFDIDIDIPTRETTPAIEGSFAGGGLASLNNYATKRTG